MQLFKKIYGEKSDMERKRIQKTKVFEQKQIFAYL